MQYRQRADFMTISKTLGAFLLLGSLPGQAAAPAADALRQFVDNVSTLSAKFEQVQSDEDGRVLQTSSGEVFLERAATATAAGRFRWNYQKPYAQLLVCDGDTIWMYDPDLAQVTARPAAQTLAGTPAELLSRRGVLDQQFSQTLVGVENGAQHLRLAPKSADSEFREIELWLKGGVPQRMRFKDPLGGSNEIRFSDTRTNVALDSKLFRFDIPKGVDVVRSDAATR